MQHKLSTDVQRYSNRRRRNTRHRLLGCVAGILVFCITYAALLPAISQAAPYISEAVKTLMAPTYEYNPSDKYTSYTYSDNDIDVVVQLPADSNVPKDAILRVTPIKETHAEYASLASKAEKAVNGAVKQAQFYDISFYTEQMEYIPVDDRAKVSINYSTPTMDINSDILVLHYDENDDNPITLDKTDFTEEPYTSEQELTFETDGFSVFAVVEVQTGSYTATALTNAEITAILATDNGTESLDGRTFVIGPDYVIGGVNYALTNETVTIHEKYPDNAAYDHEFERLKAGVVQHNGNTITTPADDGFLWKFIKVNGDNTDNTYYIQSVETGQYLYIGPGRTVKTTATPNAIVVGYVGKNGKGNVSLWAASGEYLNCYNDINSITEVIKVFDAKENDNSWNEVFLAEYTGVENDETPAATDNWPLDGRQFVISSLNGDRARVMTNEQSKDGRTTDRYLLKAVEKQATVDENGNLSVELDGIVGASVWTFTKVEGQSNTYYIKAANGYLNLSAQEGEQTSESSLTLSAKPQPIKVTNSENNTVTLSASVVNSSGVEETRFVNYYDISQDKGGPGFGCYTGGTKLSLTEYIDQGSVLGTGGQFVISSLNGNTVRVMTNEQSNDKRNGVEDRNLLKAVEKEVEKDATVDANGNLSYVALDGIVNTSVWTFMQVGKQSDTYYIQSADGKYLNLSVKEGVDTPESSLTLSDKPQPIIVTNSENNTVTLSASVVNSSGVEETRFVNYYGLRQDEGGPSFGCYNGGTNLSLTEYIDQASVLGTNGGQFVISIPMSGTNTVSVLTNEQITDPAPNSTTQVLAADVRTVDANGNVNIDRIDTSAVWDFQPVDDKTNTYYIRSVATGKYLNLDGNENTHSLTTSEVAQAIEVEFIGNRIALKIPGTDNYVHWQQFNGAKANRGFATWGGLNPVETHLVLTKYTPTQEDPTQNYGEPVTNLAGKVGILCAVDKPGVKWVYSAIVTDKPTDEDTFADGRVGLQTVPTDGDMVAPDDKEFSTVELTNYSNMIWKIIGTNADGKYYIQSQSTGKYLHLDENGAYLTDEPQTLEIIRASTEWWPNAICVRASVGGINYYLNLHGNDYTKPVSAWSFDGKDTPGDNSNNFVFAELSEKEMASIKKVTDLIDALPNQEALVNSVKDLLGQDIPTQAQNLQKKTIADASAAIKAYDALTAEQKLFVGVDRINKIEELRKWLLDESAEGGESTANANTGRLPEVVQSATASGVTVKLFNYTEAVTKEGFYDDGFRFFNDNGNNVDGVGWHYGYVDKVHINNDGTYNPNITYKLNEAGYPVLVDGEKEVDLSNLFNGKYDNYEMNDGGGLFRQDENGYYFYYSDMNAAYYDQSQGKFILYDTIVRPGNTSWNNDNLSWNPSGTYESDRRSNFLPFNALINTDGTSSIIYDSEYHQENNAENIAGSHGLELTGEQTTVPTAVLNDRTDLWFGMNIEFNFLMPEGGTLNGEPMMFDFHGDDDVWVFIDGVPVLDLSGTHAAWDGSIDFATGKVRNQYEDDAGKGGEALYKETTLKQLFIDAANAYIDDDITYNEASDTVKINDTVIAFNGDTLADFTTHNLKFFYLERGGFISYSGIKFNMPTLPEQSLTVSKAVTSDDGKKINDQTYYTFRILQASDDNKDGQLDPFFKEGMQFEILENGVSTGEFGYIDPITGMFSIKAGQTAMFYNILQYTADLSERNLIVQEIIYDEKTDQYKAVQINGVKKDPEQNKVQINGEEIDNVYKFNHENDEVYTFELQDAADGGNVAFTNVIQPPTSTLQITKKQTEDADFDEQEFQFVVLLGDEHIVKPKEGSSDSYDLEVDLAPIPVGTQYTVKHQDQSTTTEYVETAGIITLKVGETATIEGLVLGTNYEVSEIVEEDQGYMVESYAVVDKNGSVIKDATITASSASGEITDKNQTVKVTVTNAPYDFAINLHISKQVIGYNKTDTFIFDIERGTFDSKTGVWTRAEDGELPNATITVDSNDIKSGTAVVGFKNNEVEVNKEYYILIKESQSASGYIYDSTQYLATIKISKVEGEGDKLKAEMTNLQKIVYDSNGKYVKLDNVSKVGNEFPITFVNYGTYATVTKKVTAGETGGEFIFQAKVEYAYNLDFIWPQSESYDVSVSLAQTDVKVAYITFTLKDGESVSFPIPTDSTVTVTETNPEGYITSYQVTQTSSGGIGAITSGTVAEAYVTTGPLTVNFFNQGGYKLPETGGAGTQFYTFGGLLLMAVPLMYGYKRKRAWKGGEMA